VLQWAAQPYCKKTARQIAAALRRSNTVICVGIYFAENSSKSNQYVYGIVGGQAALYTRKSPVTYAIGNSSSYLKDIFNREV